MERRHSAPLLLACVLGVVVGLSSLRVRDDFLAITTMGVVFAKPDKGDRILLVTTGQEAEVDEEDAESPEIVDADGRAEGGEIPSDGASEGVGEQDDVLGSDESAPSSDGDTDLNQE